MAERALPASGSAPAHREALGELIAATSWIDTHEHLVEESQRLAGGATVLELYGEQYALPHDFAALLVHYSRDDLVAAGMAVSDAALLHDPAVEPERKWRLVEPWLPAARNTGYLRATDLSTEILFGLRLGPETWGEIEAGLRELWKPGFYRHVLHEVAGVERCHVNTLDAMPFCESADPELLQQDLSLVPLVLGRDPRAEQLAGIEVATLDDYLAVIEWCFERYAGEAVAAKCQWAYYRPLAVSAVAEPPRRAFERLRADAADEAERRTVEDFLFNRCVELASEHGLPFKLHLGHLSNTGLAPMRWVPDHVREVIPLVQAHPRTQFVLMHIAWPQSEQLLAVAKHHANVAVDLCWAWILAPRSCGEFVRRFLTTVPANKLLCFGGDHIVAENVVGHAELARRGLRDALADLVAEEWLGRAEAEALVPRLMRGNAEEIFPR